MRTPIASSLRSVVPATVLALLLSGCYATVPRDPAAGPDLGTENLRGLILTEGQQRVEFSPRRAELRWEGDRLVVTGESLEPATVYEIAEMEELLYRELREGATVGAVTLFVTVGAILYVIASADLAPDVGPIF